MLTSPPQNLAEILSERESISMVMQSALDEATDPWGVKVGEEKEEEKEGEEETSFPW